MPDWPRRPASLREAPRLVRSRVQDVLRPLLSRCERGVPEPDHVAPGAGKLNGVLWLLPRSDRDPFARLFERVDRYGDVVRSHIGPPQLHLVQHFLRHPDHVERVLSSNRANYPKSFSYQVLGGVLGEGLLTTEGDLWLRHRRMLQAVFSRRRLASLVPPMAEAAEDLLARWDPWADTGARIDAAAEMTRFTLDVVGRALFGTDVVREARELGDHLTFLLRELARRLDSGVGALSLIFVDLPGPRNHRILRAVDGLDGIVHRLIAERRDKEEGREDLLSLLLAARDEGTGAGLTDRQVRDHVMTFLLAGHETTANALAWALYLLSLHPRVARAVREEAVDALRGRTPTADDLERLPYTRAVVSEALRLYPPVPFLERDVLEDDHAGGYRIPAGSMVSLSPYLTHRHPEFWQHPEGFDPERFLGDRAKGRPRFAYFPFGGGPRQCIGAGFAVQEAVLGLTTIVRRFRLELTPGARVEPHPGITLRPRNGVPMTIHRHR